jgi:DNA-binding MarR family transcriptional regulator
MPDEKDRLVDRIQRVEEWFLLLTIRDRSSGLFSLNLTIQQLRVLMLLFAEGGMSAHKLAEAIAVSLATLTGIVDRLEARELVQRSVDPNDRRVRRIDLTAEGRTLVSDFVELGRERKRKLLHRLDLRVLRNLVEAVEVMRDTLAAEVAGQLDRPSGDLDRPCGLSPDEGRSRPAPEA